MSNVGNTCYLNAVLQCLSSIKSFTDRVLALNVTSSDKPGLLVRSYNQLMHGLWKTTHPLDMSAFKSRVNSALPEGFRGVGPYARQQDAHELLHHMLDLMHEGTRLPGNGVASVPTTSVCEDFFHGNTRATLACPKCNHTQSYDTLTTTLQVPISAKPLVVLVRVWHPQTLEFDDERFSLPHNATVHDLQTAIHQRKTERLNSSNGRKRRRKCPTGTGQGSPSTLPRIYKPGLRAMIPERVASCMHGKPVLVRNLLKNCAAALYSFLDEEERSNLGLLQKLRSHEDLVRAGVVHPATAPVTLMECLGHGLFNTETLNEDNKWTCSLCKQKVRATKQIRLSKLPNVLVVQLKRFEWDKLTSAGTTKKHDCVDFPCGLERLDVRQFLVENMNVGSSKYRLNAVVRHHGKSMHQGHYTAVARHQPRDQWHLFDDGTTPVQLEPGELHKTIVNKSAYLLVYQKEA
jgi:ubiquitin C-terminal hydrolase